MDTSPEYILMCEKAERTVPELFYRGTFNSHDFTFQVPGNDLSWWLPRQDQLQEMLLADGYGIWALLLDFAKYAQQVLIHEQVGKSVHETPYESMEQLWLAFVMKEKHQKAWNGKEWKDA